MCRSTGALQVLHLGTCYSLRGYPGRGILYARSGRASIGSGGSRREREKMKRRGVQTPQSIY